MCGKPRAAQPAPARIAPPPAALPLGGLRSAVGAQSWHLDPGWGSRSPGADSQTRRPGGGGGGGHTRTERGARRKPAHGSGLGNVGFAREEVRLEGASPGPRDGPSSRSCPGSRSPASSSTTTCGRPPTDTCSRWAPPRLRGLGAAQGGQAEAGGVGTHLRVLLTLCFLCFKKRLKAAEAESKLKQVYIPN